MARHSLSASVGRTPRAIWEEFMERFNVRIHQWYAAVEGGKAEGSAAVTSNHKEEKP